MLLVRFVRGMGRVRLMILRWMLDVGRWTFAALYRHKFHPAFRTISRMISYDFGMHRAGVFLHLSLLLACRAVGRRGDRRRVLHLRAM